ncbi:MAG: HNH endonuclease signature motif containing protein [Pseudomonadota bacterium]
MARKPRESEARWQTAAAADVPTCPLCGRPIPRHARQSLHHLVPKLKGGTHGETVLLHQICHNEIHATLTEVELARDYASIEALRSHPRLARFIRWVAKKDPAFHSRSQKNPRRKRR